MGRSRGAGLRRLSRGGNEDNDTPLMRSNNTKSAISYSRFGCVPPLVFARIQ